MVPPMHSIRALLMLRPRPVPPNSLVMEGLDCEKAEKICSRSFSGIPMPLSETENLSLFLKVSLSNSTLTLMKPWKVNLIELETKLSRTCLILVVSALIILGTAGSISNFISTSGQDLLATSFCSDMALEIIDLTLKSTGSSTSMLASILA